MIQLHYAPGNASMTPHMLLEELGVPFELKQVDRENNAHKVARVPQAQSERLDPGVD